jgi:hypothetical protein
VSGTEVATCNRLRNAIDYTFTAGKSVAMHRGARYWRAALFFDRDVSRPTSPLGVASERPACGECFANALLTVPSVSPNFRARALLLSPVCNRTFKIWISRGLRLTLRIPSVPLNSMEHSGQGDRCECDDQNLRRDAQTLSTGDCCVVICHRINPLEYRCQRQN